MADGLLTTASPTFKALTDELDPAPPAELHASVGRVLRDTESQTNSYPARI
jgi:hypothetical protein